MKKEALYISVFGVLCVLAGVLVGAAVVKKTGMPAPGFQKPDFAERAGRLMKQRPGMMFDKNGPGGRLFTGLSEKLDLDEGQKTKVKEILEKTRQDLNQVGESVRGTIAAIREKSDKQIMEILSPEQQVKFKELIKEHNKNIRPGIGRGANGPGVYRGPGMGQGPRPGEEVPPPQQQQ